MVRWALVSTIGADTRKIFTVQSRAGLDLEVALALLLRALATDIPFVILRDGNLHPIPKAV
jgi:hypothetical protein